MKKTNERIQTVTTHSHYAIHGQIVAIQKFIKEEDSQSDHNPDVSIMVEQFFVKLSSNKFRLLKGNKGESKVIPKIKHEDKYYYFSDEMIEKLRNVFLNDEILRGLRPLLQEITSINAFDVITRIEEDPDGTIDHLYRFNYNSYMIIGINGNVLARPFLFDYCESQIRSSKYYLKKVFESFSNNPYIKNLEKETIPGYNAEYDGEKALKFVIDFPQDIFDKYVAIAKKRSSDLWSPTFKYLIIHSEELGIEEFEKMEEEDL